MLLIGENLNVINRIIGRAFREKDPGPIAEEAKRQKEKGMDWIDINLGPARKGGAELMEFVVRGPSGTRPLFVSIPLISRPWKQVSRPIRGRPLSIPSCAGRSDMKR
jgi:cobalamin-dependent methionine synthase I